MRKISPFLWFDGQAEDAAKFYVSLFPNAAISKVSRYPADAPGGNSEGAVMTVEFEIDGVTFVALNGGPDFKFNEAVSLSVDCDGQAEVDRYWRALTEGGEEGPCGWCKDRFGVSWQITPRRLIELTTNPDPAVSRPATEAMMTMRKIDIAALEEAVAAAA